MADEVTLLEQGKTLDYVRRQCLKMCYYLQKVRSIEILQMRTEFLVDENSNVWFTYATNVQYRELKDRIALSKVENSKAALTL